MKKIKNALLLVCFIFVALIGIVSFAIDVNFTCSEKDLLLYRFGGFAMFMFPALGFLVEFIISKLGGIKKKPVLKRLLFWSVLLIASIVSFSLCYGITSEEFKNSMESRREEAVIIDEKAVSVADKDDKNKQIETKKGNAEQSSKETQSTDEAKTPEQTEYQKLSDAQFKLLTEMVVKSFYSFSLDEKDYQRVFSDEAVMGCLTKIYDYAHNNYFALEPNYKAAVSERVSVVRSISNYKSLQEKFLEEYYRDDKAGVWLYKISSYSIDPADVVTSENTMYIDAEGYLNPGVVLYWNEDGEFVEAGEVEEIAYKKQIDGTFYGYAVKINYYDDPYASGWYSGDQILRLNKSFSGKPLFYIKVLDPNRRIAREEIDYDSGINWKPLSKTNAKPNVDVYYGMSTTKSYIFTIKDVNKKADEISVEYANGNIEKKSYSAILQLGYLYIKR